MDWKIEQLRELQTALHNALEKRIYINGQPCVVKHALLVQPSVAANHAGRSLEIDAVDPDGNRHEIRLYTSEWPKDRR